MALKIKPLEASEVEFLVSIEPELTPFVGNCSAIDEATDREQEAWIRSELRKGNDAAWCTLIVRVHWKGFSGWTSLGGCSYRSEAEAIRAADEYDMKADALADLNQRLQSVARDVFERTVCDCPQKCQHKIL